MPTTTTPSYRRPGLGTLASAQSPVRARRTHEKIETTKTPKQKQNKQQNKKQPARAPDSSGVDARTANTSPPPTRRYRFPILSFIYRTHPRLQTKKRCSRSAAPWPREGPPWSYPTSYRTRRCSRCRCRSAPAPPTPARGHASRCRGRPTPSDRRRSTPCRSCRYLGGPPASRARRVQRSTRSIYQARSESG